MISKFASNKWVNKTRLKREAVMASNSFYTYTYVLNNPLRFVDPSGYSSEDFYSAEALNDYNPSGEAWNDTYGPSGASYGFSFGWFRSRSWTLDPKTGQAFNTFTGERVDASDDTYKDDVSGNTHKVFVDPSTGQKFIYHLVPVEGKTWMITPFNKAITFNWIPQYLTRNNSMNPASNFGSTWDPVTNRRIDQLHQDVRGSARQFVNQVESQLGIKLRVTSGYRSFAEQNVLYAKGRNAPGSIVTKAKGGYSYHNYGLAIDVVEIANGEAIWNTSWSAISEIGISIGFEWGGNFKGFSDKPHFQMTFGYSISQLLNLYNSGQW